MNEQEYALLDALFREMKDLAYERNRQTERFRKVITGLQALRDGAPRGSVPRCYQQGWAENL